MVQYRKCCSYPENNCGIFPGQKHGPDIWTYLVRCLLPCRSSARADRWFEHSLKSLHPLHWWCASTNDSHKLREQWHKCWRARPLMFYRYVRVIVSFSGFTKEVFSEAWLHNAKRDAYQPILLLDLSGDQSSKWLGKDIAKRLSFPSTATRSSTSSNVKLASVRNLSVISFPPEEQQPQRTHSKKRKKVRCGRT
jgi:hypothetical protein